MVVHIWLTFLNKNIFNFFAAAFRRRSHAGTLSNNKSGKGNKRSVINLRQSVKSEAPLNDFFAENVKDERTQLVLSVWWYLYD